METKDVLRQLREKNNLTQDQMAARVMVTRQAVSRWENGERRSIHGRYLRFHRHACSWAYIC